MKFLIIGSGAREHAIAAALHRSTQKPEIYCIGSSLNPGIQALCVDYATGNISDPAFVTQKAQQWQIGIAFIGPEAPLEQGVADALWALQIPTIGPKKTLARIETSKSFARDLMQKYQLPGLPRYHTFENMNGVDAFLRTFSEDGYVVKANGLMGGKGVKVAGVHLQTYAEALAFCEEIIAAKQTIVIEEKLIGQEFSFMCFCDGESLIPMPIVQDHKRAFVGDVGPNTGGMGSYSDVNHRLPFLTESDVEDALIINHAVIRALAEETGEKYIGVIYGSFIATSHGVAVIEFNARFGDPESLNVLSILSSDFVEICRAWVGGQLHASHVRFANQATVCKYAVPTGYPDAPLKNGVIEIDDLNPEAPLYLAAIDLRNNQLIATGSRTAACVGVADSISKAEQAAESAISKIHGPVFHREDIGTAPLIQKYIDMMQRLRSI